jgi:DNA-binding transcriptional LysR family regulator
MVAVPLPYRLDFCIVVSPDYLAARSPPKIPADLMAHRCLRAKIQGGGLSRWEFEKQGEAMALDVPGPLMLDEQSLMLRAAIDGMGLAYIARIMASEAIAADRLRCVLDDWMPHSPPLCLYYPRNRNTSAALRSLIAVVRTGDRVIGAP